MCLAVPGKVISIEGDHGQVDILGVRHEAELSLLEDVKVGDYVLLHAGFAIEVLDEDSANETLELFQEMMETNEN